MNFLSKEAPLRDSIKTMQTVLENVGSKSIFSEQKHPLQNCFSVNLSSIEAPRHIYSNGKGSLGDAAVASALGEYIERLQTNNFFADFYLPKRRHSHDEVLFDFEGEYLNAELKDIYNPNNELQEEDLVDFNSDHLEKIVAIPFLKNSTQEEIFFPVNILNNLYVSNGLASGNTPLEAQVQALSEIFERHAKLEIIKNGYALPLFPQDILKQFPKLLADIETLKESGFIVEVLDASLGGIFPVTAISLINQKTATLFVSFGSHPILEVSLERTMSELMQGRLLSELDSFETPTFDLSVVADSFNLESHFVDSNGKLGFHFLSAKKSFLYSPWCYEQEGVVQEHTFLMNILKKIDKESYLREYTYLGFYSCQIIVPSLSEVYPIEDLTYNNKNSAKRIRDMVLNFQEYDAEDIFIEIESLEESLNMEKYLGVIFENNFTLIEFKAQLHLEMGETAEALEILEYGTNRLGHLIVELARMEELELNFSDYEDALYAIYTKEQVLKALSILDGDAMFIDLTLHKEYKNVLALYDKLDAKKTHSKTLFKRT